MNNLFATFPKFYLNKSAKNFRGSFIAATFYLIFILSGKSIKKSLKTVEETKSKTHFLYIGIFI